MITFITQKFSDLSIKVKLQLFSLFFLLSIVTILGYVFLFLAQQGNEGQVINVAGRQRMLIQKMTKEFFLAEQIALESKQPINWGSMQKSIELFEVTLTALRKGGRTYSDLALTKPITIPQAIPQAQNQLAMVSLHWQELLDRIHVMKDQPVTMDKLTTINQKSTELLAEMNQAVSIMAKVSDERVLEMERNQVIIAIIAFFISIGLSMLIQRSLMLPISQLLQASLRLAKGDLKPYEQHQRSKNEVGQLAQHIECMRVSLHNVLVQVQQNSRQMAHSAFQVSTVSSEISNSNRQGHENSEQVNQALSSLESKAAVVNENLDETQHWCQQTNSLAEQGLEAVTENIQQLGQVVENVHQTSSQMTELKEFTSKINEITVSIHNIAEQTNLLALNAAIEAARAGDQGRGFAVVAQEVRELAGRTSQSSSEISDLITQLTCKVQTSADSMMQVVENVNSSQEKANQTADSFMQLKTGISQTQKNTQALNQQNQDQTEHLKYLVQALQSLFDVMSQSSDKAETTAMIASDLNQISEQLDQQLQHFHTELFDSVIKETKEQRQHPRANNKLRVVLVQAGQRVEGLTQDISLSGLKMRSKRALEIHKPAQVTILWEDQQTKQKQELKLKAMVVHKATTGEQYEFGLEFLAVSQACQAELKKIFSFFKQPYKFKNRAEIAAALQNPGFTSESLCSQYQTKHSMGPISANK